MNKNIITLILLVLTLYGCTHNDETDISNVQEKQFHVQIIDCAYWLDGGSNGFKIIDNDGKPIDFCFDFRLSTKTEGELYIGNWSINEKAHFVMKDSEEAEHIISISERFLKDNLESHTKQKINESNWKNLTDLQKCVIRLRKNIERYKKE